MAERMDRQLCGEGELMARMTFSIASKSYFDKLSAAAPTRIKNAVKSGTDLLATFTEDEARSLGVDDTGDTIRSIQVKGPYNRSGTITGVVTYQGIHSGNPRRNAEVAFVNEYGARGRPARPFNRRAIELHEDAVVERMAEIIEAE